jgi:hypothetical protein
LRIPWQAGDSDDLAVLLRLQTGLEGLVRDIGHGDANDEISRSSVNISATSAT